MDISISLEKDYIKVKDKKGQEFLVPVKALKEDYYEIIGKALVMRDVGKINILYALALATKEYFKKYSIEEKESNPYNIGAFIFDFHLKDNLNISIDELINQSKDNENIKKIIDFYFNCLYNDLSELEKN